MNTNTSRGLLLGLPDPAAAEAGSCWRLGCAQHIGARRQQQDCMGAQLGTFRGKPALLAVLADGMGGMKNGAAFSRITVEYHVNHFQHVLDTSSDLSAVLLRLAIEANREAHTIYEEDQPGGTTLVTALFAGDRYYILSVGDSRLCLFRRNEKAGRYCPLQLNREHTLGPVLDERAWSGAISFEDAEDNRFRDSLNSAIGEKRIRRVDLTDRPSLFMNGDRLVLMSDGIYRFASEEELSLAVGAAPGDAAEKIVGLIRAKNRPHQDNMSILIIEKIPAGKEEQGDA